jgi:hypothetical protein
VEPKLLRQVVATCEQAWTEHSTGGSFQPGRDSVAGKGQRLSGTVDREEMKGRKEFRNIKTGRRKICLNTEEEEEEEEETRIILHGAKTLPTEV